MNSFQSWGRRIPNFWANHPASGRSMVWAERSVIRSVTVWWMPLLWCAWHALGIPYPSSSAVKFTRLIWTSKMIDENAEVLFAYINMLYLFTFFYRLPPERPIPPRRNVTFTLKVDHCKGVNFLEHVQARISLTTQRRGDIVIYITSPAGTRTCLLTERYNGIIHIRVEINSSFFLS